MGWAFLAVSIWGAAFTVNAHWPRKPRSLFIVPSFFASWMTSELAAHHLSWQAAATVAFVVFGALDSWPGWVGLGITLVSWVGLLTIVTASTRSAATVEAALAGISGLGAAPERDRLARLPLMIPFLLRDRRVAVTRNLRYAEGAGRRHLLDVYRPRNGVTGAPVLLQVHGGGWTVGNKRQQALPLVMHMAASGWVVVAINYRLSPKATFPAHVIDVKLALAWIRENIAEHGGDPDFVCITGGSAGGHLTALAALTPNDPEYQSGFEQVETSVRAAVPFYGVYDWTNRGGHGRGNDGFGGFIERVVMKRRVTNDRGAFESASPLYRVNGDAPPFLVVHGTSDSLVTFDGAEDFVDALREASHEPVAFVALPGAQHAFEVFHSLRTDYMVRGVERFLTWVHQRHKSGIAADRDAVAPEAATMEDTAASERLAVSGSG